jgi:hypothetical protein
VSHFLDLSSAALNKAGEELCGDQIRVLRTDDRTRVVLSDGLGSGVKANILATLTSGIIITMLREDVPLVDVIETVAGTLPVCQVRKLAYATFTIIEVDHHTYDVRVINFDNPPVFYFREGCLSELRNWTETILGRRMIFSEGRLENGDFLAAISDGVWYAGLGQSYNFGWGWENVASYIQTILSRRVRVAQTVVDEVMDHTRKLYGNTPGDDASLVGLLLRGRQSAMVFTGPPLDKAQDVMYARRLLDFPGRRIVCGGTTANIVARQVGREVDVLLASLDDDVPPMGRLPGVHLVTEGILTLNKAIRAIEAAQGDLVNLPDEHNGAILLALELLAADDITFVVGQQVNAFYQNPMLPDSVSIRPNLVRRLVTMLRGLHKHVTVHYC